MRGRTGLSILAAGLAAQALSRRTPPPLALRASPAAYSPAMSSTVGIAISPSLPPGAAADAVVVWRANYGQFLRWAAPDYRVIALGPRVATGVETLYWSYDANDAGAEKPDVEIVVSLRSAGRVAAEGTVRVGWDGATARVRD